MNLGLVGRLEGVRCEGLNDDLYACIDLSDLKL